MKTQLHRGRLIDHIQLIVHDLELSQNFYSAIMKVLDIPIITTSEDFFWADELVVSSINSPAAQGILTGRHHLAFQAKDRATGRYLLSSCPCSWRQRQWQTR